MIGSSKGGYSSIYYGFCIPNSIVIAGAPQYFLADYLNNDGTKTNLAFLLHEDFSEDNYEKLNLKLKNLIRTSPIRPNKIFLHFSNKEHTYEDHIKYMLEDFKSFNVIVETDIGSYTSHSGVADAYPLYLTKILNTLKGL